MELLSSSKVPYHISFKIMVFVFATSTFQQIIKETGSFIFVDLKFLYFTEGFIIIIMEMGVYFLDGASLAGASPDSA